MREALTHIQAAIRSLEKVVPTSIEHAELLWKIRYHLDRLESKCRGIQEDLERLPVTPIRGLGLNVAIDRPRLTAVVNHARDRVAGIHVVADGGDAA